MYEKKETPPVSCFSLTLLLRPVLSAFVVDEFPNFLEPLFGFSPNELRVVPPLFFGTATATRFKADHISTEHQSVDFVVEVFVLEWNKPLFGFIAEVAGDVNQFARCRAIECVDFKAHSPTATATNDVETENPFETELFFQPLRILEATVIQTNRHNSYQFRLVKNLG